MSPPKEQPKPASSHSERGDVGHIGKSVVIRGELTGNEDLYLDGDIEGTVDLRDHKLVIGPNGKIKATTFRISASNASRSSGVSDIDAPLGCHKRARERRVDVTEDHHLIDRILV